MPLSANTHSADTKRCLRGYARVSTEEQDTRSQIDALQKAGCSTIDEEHASGADRDRPILSNLLQTIQTGETLVVTRLVSTPN
jgi:DNA invertase Pin-like site-specific DNA recombinase